MGFLSFVILPLSVRLARVKLVQINKVYPSCASLHIKLLWARFELKQQGRNALNCSVPEVALRRSVRQAGDETELAFCARLVPQSHQNYY